MSVFESVEGIFARSEIVAHRSNGQGHTTDKRRPAGLMIERDQLGEGILPSWAAVVPNLDASRRQVGQGSRPSWKKTHAKLGRRE
jgi:hypothetical protein